VQEDVDRGKRPDLVGGGLIRSRGGWAQVISMRRRGDRESADERILGQGHFVERVLQEADETVRNPFLSRKRCQDADRLIQTSCDAAGIRITELSSGSRRSCISKNVKKAG